MSLGNLPLVASEARPAEALPELGGAPMVLDGSFVKRCRPKVDFIYTPDASEPTPT